MKAERREIGKGQRSSLGPSKSEVFQWLGSVFQGSDEPKKFCKGGDKGNKYQRCFNIWDWHKTLLLLLLSCFSHVRLCATPQTAAHQAPPSLGFSRQEHWSGLPFPSPMHKSGKWKGSRSVVSDSLQPHGLQPTRLLCPWEFPGKSTGVGCQCIYTLVYIK